MAMASPTLILAGQWPAAAGELRLGGGARTSQRPVSQRSVACRRRRLGRWQPRAEISYFNPQEGKKAVDEDGYTIVDVRDERQYKRAHIPGSLHIPLYVENKDTDPGTLLKRQAHNNFAGALYGLAFTKPNDNFVQDVQKAFSKDQKLLLLCQEGLRSGTATQQLDKAGFSNVAMITSGLQKVPPGTFPKDGKTELKDAGKGGFVTIQTQFSVVLAIILGTAYLYLEFFPDDAAKLFERFAPK